MDDPDAIGFGGPMMQKVASTYDIRLLAIFVFAHRQCKPGVTRRRSSGVNRRDSAMDAAELGEQ